jgi:hypothetical protein
LGAFSRRFSGVKTALSAIMKTLLAFSYRFNRLRESNRFQRFDFAEFARSANSG